MRSAREDGLSCSASSVPVVYTLYSASSRSTIRWWASFARIATSPVRILPEGLRYFSVSEGLVLRGLLRRR
jgi:hypothetical protein